MFDDETSSSLAQKMHRKSPCLLLNFTPKETELCKKKPSSFCLLNRKATQVQDNLHWNFRGHNSSNQSKYIYRNKDEDVITNDNYNSKKYIAIRI